MSKINFFALGGVQENGKNLYVVEVDKKLFILDCGLKYPNSDLHGVDVIVNDLTYLIENKDRIVGVFLSHANEDHIGGVSYLLKEIKTKVYASHFTLLVLKDKLKDAEISYEESDLIEVTSRSLVKVDEVNVRFFETAHNIPECLGIAIKTNDGYIIYTSNYNFDQNAKINYSLMFRSLAVFSKEGVLALLSECLGANNEQSRGTILEFKIRLQNIITQAKNRLIFTFYSSDILRMQMLIDIAVAHNKKIAIITKKSQKIINQALKAGYLKIPQDNWMNLKYIDDKNLNDDPNLVVLVTGDRQEAYRILQKMSRGIDRLIHLTETDSVYLLTKPMVGIEKMAAKTLDMIYHVTSNVKEFNANLLPSYSASREEIKEMINILKPKYLIPVIGEYRHQYNFRVVANCIGYKDDKVLIADNGDILSFENGAYVGITGDVPCGEVLIDGKAFKDVSDVVMRDRELLAEDGVLLISANVNPRTKQILVGPEIVTKGFTYQEKDEFYQNINEIFKKVSETYLSYKFINWSEYKLALKNEVSHFIYKQIKRNPIIIPVLISTDIEMIKLGLNNKQEQ